MEFDMPPPSFMNATSHYPYNFATDCTWHKKYTYLSLFAFLVCLIPTILDALLTRG